MKYTAITELSSEFENPQMKENDIHIYIYTTTLHKQLLVRFQCGGLFPCYETC